MFAGLIFASLVLQLAAATRPAERSRSDTPCTESGNDTCQTCSGSGSNEICLTCKNNDHFLTTNKKGCKAACDATGEIETPGANPKACKCDDASGYQLQGDGTCAVSNTNKSSGLSTGAIAGIAVAAVIVVGGLVGFLCWWFLCRGKA